MHSESFRNFSLVFFSRVIIAGFQAAFYLILASILEPNLYGEISYWVAIASTFSIIFRFGLPFSISVFQAKKYTKLSQQINFLAFVTSCISALILLPVSIFAAFLALSISFFVMTLFNLLGLQKYKTHLKISTINGSLFLTIPIILFYMFELEGILLGMGIANIIGGIFYLKLVKFDISSFKIIKPKFHVLIHNFGIDVSNNLPRMIDKILIVPLLGFFLTGLYQLNLQILFALEILPIALHSFLLSEESSGKKHNRLLYFIVIISIVIVIIAYFISPFAIQTIFPKYVEALPSLQILLPSLIPLSISAIFSSKLQAEESTKVGYSGIVRIGSLLSLIAILGPSLGLIGLSLSVLLSASINTLFLSILYYKIKH